MPAGLHGPRPRARRTVPAALALLAIALTGCSGHRPDPAPGGAGSEGPASSLRATLTGLLRQDVYTAGLLARGAHAGQDAAISDARATLSAIGGSVGSAAGGPLGNGTNRRLTLRWEAREGALASYVAAAVRRDSAGTGAAKAGLATADAGVADALHAGDSSISVDQVRGNLTGADGALLTGLDGLVAGSPQGLTDLDGSAAAMDNVAKTISDAVATARPDKVTGASAGSAAALRAALVALLRGHVGLLALATAQDKAAAGQALAADTAQLSRVLATGTAQPTLAAAFGRPWTALSDALLSAATGSDPGAGQAQAEQQVPAVLDALAAAVPGLDRGAIEAALRAQLSATVAAIRPATGGTRTASPVGPATSARDAGRQADEIARLLAQSVSRARPGVYS